MYLISDKTGIRAALLGSPHLHRAFEGRNGREVLSTQAGRGETSHRVAADTGSAAEQRDRGLGGAQSHSALGQPLRLAAPSQPQPPAGR